MQVVPAVVVAVTDKSKIYIPVTVGRKDAVVVVPLDNVTVAGVVPTWVHWYVYDTPLVAPWEPTVALSVAIDPMAIDWTSPADTVKTPAGASCTTTDVWAVVTAWEPSGCVLTTLYSKP